MHPIAAMIASSWSVKNAKKYVAVDALTPISSRSNDGNADCIKKRINKIISIGKIAISGTRR